MIARPWPKPCGYVTHSWDRSSAFAVIWMICAIGASAQETPPESTSATVLRAQYGALGEQLEQSQIRPGVYLESSESSRTSRGDIYAVVDYAFATIDETFKHPENWCEALILHLNVKYCHASTGDRGALLTVAIGKKTEQPLKETHRIAFAYDNAASAPDYSQIVLVAAKGPLGTRNYNISLEMIALGGEQSFLHLRYEYSYGPMARLAMRVYLSGSNKVGFTMIEGRKGRPPHLVGGVRGALERNTLRYFLAIEAYLGALTAPAPARFDESLERWFAATERHALQLHEVDHDAYVSMKRHEYLRQQQISWRSDGS